ncbi:hypothetical protein JCM5350_003378 [Sporobolomyces pararoseus]
MLSRSTTVSSASSTESKSTFRRFFSLRRSKSTSTSERESLVAKEPEVDLFAQIMVLNARHGHPSVQAHSFKVQPVEKKSKTTKRSTSSVSKVESIPSGPPPAYDAFEAIMRINAKHGHPSVQALFAR